MSEFTHHKTRDVGDILTDAFQYIRLHYKSLGTSLLYFVLPIYIVQFFLMRDYSNQLFGTLFSPESSSLSDIFGWEYFLALFLSLLGSAVLAVVTIKHVALTEVDAEVTPEAILENISPVIFKYLILFFLLGLILFISALFFLIPAIFLGVKLCLSSSALILEDNSVGGALNRSWELTKEYWWNTFGVLIIMYVLTIAVTYALLIPVTILSILTLDSGFIAANGGLLENFFFVLTGVLTAVSSLIYTVIYISICLQYYNLVERKEGTDLRSRIEGLAD